MTDRRAVESGVVDGSLPRWRMARPGRPASGVGVWAAWVPVAALSGAVVLIACAALWPLATPGAQDPIEPQPVPRVTSSRVAVGDREAALAMLTRKNPFAIDGRFWIAPPVAVADGGDEPESGAASGGGGGGGSPGAGERPGVAGTPILARAEEMPADIKPAFENLELRGVRTGPDGAGVAMISFVQSPTRPLSTEYRVGEEFSDEKFPQARWYVESIDVVRDRVVLERTGKRVSLALYPAEPVPVVVVPEAEPAGAEVAPSVLVVGATREQIVADLREAGVDDQEIVRLMRLLEADPAAFAAAQAQQLEAPKGAESAPAGLDAVMRLMQGVEKKKDAPPATDPPPPPPRG